RPTAAQQAFRAKGPAQDAALDRQGEPDLSQAMSGQRRRLTEPQKLQKASSLVAAPCSVLRAEYRARLASTLFQRPRGRLLVALSPKVPQGRKPAETHPLHPTRGEDRGACPDSCRFLR